MIAKGINVAKIEKREILKIDPDILLQQGSTDSFCFDICIFGSSKFDFDC